MPLVEPKIDDRDYNQILKEALARIPVHNPEWTNFNSSDPGITIIQLFAFMTENLLYRSNLIPKRNRIKFLKLLGIPLYQGEPARGIISFSNTKGPLKNLHIPLDTEVFQGQMPYRTEDGVDVLPIEAQVYYKSKLPKERKEKVQDLYLSLYESFSGKAGRPDMYETRSLIPPDDAIKFPEVELAAKETEEEDENKSFAIDGSIWIALLSRSADENVKQEICNAISKKEISIGIMPGQMDAQRTLSPLAMQSSDTQTELIYEMPMRDKDKGFSVIREDESVVARYRRLLPRTTGNLLSQPGIAKLELPDSENIGIWKDFEPLESGTGDLPPIIPDPEIEKKVISWIRIRPAISEQQQAKASISWISINAVRITQKAHAVSEFLGYGTGEPDQKFNLINKPVIPESVKLTVDGELWHEIYDLYAACPEVPTQKFGQKEKIFEKDKVNVFRLDHESGEIFFGDGIRGKRPPLESKIQADYYYGGGKNGVVGIGEINKCSVLPAGISVINPLPTWGGENPENMEDAEKRIPGFIKHRDRLVSEEDFKEIAERTPGVEIGRIKVLSLLHPDLPDVDSPGNVTVIAIPEHDLKQPDTPSPDPLFLDAICRYLEPRRIVTTELHIRGPAYVDIYVSCGIDAIPGMDPTPVIDNVKAEIKNFLSPLKGGFKKEGWPISTEVEAAELRTIAGRVDGVSKVNSVLLADTKGTEFMSIRMNKLQMPRLSGISIRQGEPLSIKELMHGEKAGISMEGAEEVIPVPVLPRGYQC